MEKVYIYVKSLMLNYKLETYCCIAPVRAGLIFTGYFNIFMAVLCITATANESFSPTIVQVQAVLLEDNVTKTVPILAYSTELGFSALLLCGIYRNDIVLLRSYMYYCVASIILSLLVYSIVIAVIDILVRIVIILGTGFQCYVLILVRSAIVEIKYANKNGELPTLVMSSLLRKDEELKQVDIVSEVIEKDKDIDIENKDKKLLDKETKDKKVLGKETKDKSVFGKETKDKKVLVKETKDKKVIDKETKDKKVIDKETNDKKTIKKETKDKKVLDKETKDQKVLGQETKDKNVPEAKLQTVVDISKTETPSTSTSTRIHLHTENEK